MLLASNLGMKISYFNHLIARPKSKYFILGLILLSVPENVLATTITVKKIKGQQAVVEMSSSLEVGKTYNLESEGITLKTDFSTQFKSRLNSISLGAQLNLISGTKTLENTFVLNGKYGWNHSSFEFGPVINLEIYDKGFGTSTDYLLGLYYDYNIKENKSPTDLIYGPTVQFALGNKNYNAGGSSQISQLQAGGFTSWFINSSPVALRFELNYLTRKVISSNAENTLSGFNSQMYLVYYY